MNNQVLNLSDKRIEEIYDYLQKRNNLIFDNSFEVEDDGFSHEFGFEKAGGAYIVGNLDIYVPLGDIATDEFTEYFEILTEPIDQYIQEEIQEEITISDDLNWEFVSIDETKKNNENYMKLSVSYNSSLEV